MAASGWTVVSAAAAGGRWGPTVGLLLGTGAMFVLAGLVSVVSPGIVPGVVLAVVAGIAIGSIGDLLAHRGVGDPLFSNASAGLFLQGAAAGLMLFFVAHGFRWKAVAAVSVFALGAATLLTGSLAADALLVLLVVAAFVRKREAVHGVVILFAGMLLAALIATIVLGLVFPSPLGSRGVKEAVEVTLSLRRPALWHDAIELMAARPLVGVGPGRFQIASPEARADRDARWAHNGFLQQGAETGVPGFALLVAVFLWGFLRLRAHGDPDRVTAIGAASLGALGIHACVDYVLHFPPLPLVTALLVGMAGAAGGRSPVPSEGMRAGPVHRS